MKICIDEKIAKDNNLTVEEVLVTLLLRLGVDYDNVCTSLENEGRIKFMNGEYIVSQTLYDKCDTVLLNSNNSIKTKEDLRDLAEKIMLIYPFGKKPGSPYFYRGNVKEIILSLQRFQNLYSEYFNSDNIIKAVTDYVKSFHEDYSFLQLLKNFIYKCDFNTGEVTSGLADWIENNIWQEK